MNRWLVTGAAGFIGFHLAKRLLDGGDEVLGLDNLNDYYSVDLKRARIEQLAGRVGFRFRRTDLADAREVHDAFADFRPTAVANLAAQAGVRYSIGNPAPYVHSNLVGFANVLESCRLLEVEHLVYASSSSVYGTNARMPFSVRDGVDHPMSLYAATKKANELMAHAYSHLHKLPTTGLRFFTVYGPWGRPDMAYYSFTRAILENRPIELFNEGRMKRDFTYIDDVVEGIVRILRQPAAPDPHWNADRPNPGSSFSPYRVYNIGHSEPVELLRFIQILEEALGRKATLHLKPMQPGDVPATYADMSDLFRAIEYQPTTPLERGIREFVAWYRNYHG